MLKSASIWCMFRITMTEAPLCINREARMEDGRLRVLPQTVMNG